MTALCRCRSTCRKRPFPGQRGRGGHGRVDEALDRHARLARHAEKQRELRRSKRRRHHAAHGGCTLAHPAPHLREVQVGEIRMRASAGEAPDHRALVELVPEVIVDTEGLGARNTQRRIAHGGRLHTQQRVAGTRLLQDAVDRAKQRCVVDLYGRDCHARSFLVSPTAYAAAGAGRGRFPYRAPCVPGRVAAGAGRT